MNLRVLPLLALVTLAAADGCGSGRTPSRIVLITLDTTRADHLGCYGATGDPTPNLDRLASESVLFEQAVAPVPITLPSHATIFTGLDPQDHGVRYNLFYRLPEQVQTLAESLREAGYRTAAFPASRILAATFGLDQGFETYAEPPESPAPVGQYPVREMSRPAGEGVNLALAWLDSHADERVFIWLHLYDPHWPYAPPFPHSDRFRERSYQGEIAYADTELGRLLDRLRGDPEWSRTVVIVAGDHGEGLYDHDERWHTILVYESTQRVPLIVRVPGARPARVEHPVGLVDITPSLLDFAGLPPSSAARGTSLATVLTGGEPPSRPIYFESLAGPMLYGWEALRGVREGRWKLIDGDAPELFDLQSDPEEAVNLASREPRRLAALRTALELESRPMSPRGASRVAVDPETLEALSSLGYLGGGVESSERAGAPPPRGLIDLEPELVSAQGAVARGDWARVEDACQYVLERDPTNKWALAHLTAAWLRLGREDEALETALTAVRTYPDEEQSHHMLADVYRKRGSLDEAYRALRDGLLALPGSEPLRFLALVAAFDLGTEDVCSVQVPRAVAEHPGSGRLLALKARCQAREGAPERALETLEHAVELGFRRLSLIEQTDEFSSMTGLTGWRELIERRSVGSADSVQRE